MMWATCNMCAYCCDGNWETGDDGEIARVNHEVSSTQHNTVLVTVPKSSASPVPKLVKHSLSLYLLFSKQEMNPKKRSYS